MIHFRQLLHIKTAFDMRPTPKIYCSKTKLVSMETLFFLRQKLA